MSYQVASRRLHGQRYISSRSMTDRLDWAVRRERLRLKLLPHLTILKSRRNCDNIKDLRYFRIRGLIPSVRHDSLPGRGGFTPGLVHDGCTNIPLAATGSRNTKRFPDQCDEGQPYSPSNRCYTAHSRVPNATLFCGPVLVQVPPSHELALPAKPEAFPHRLQDETQCRLNSPSPMSTKTIAGQTMLARSSKTESYLFRGSA